MTYPVERLGNRIYVKGDIAPFHLRKLCARLHGAVEKRGFQDIILDFSVCDGITEAVMLPVMPLIAGYRKKGVSFECLLPQDEKLKRLFLNANWAHHISPGDYPRATHEGGHVPALRFGGDETDGDGMEEATAILNRVMDMVLGQLAVERTALKAVEWSLWEIMDNVANHAESPVGGFVQATAYQGMNRVEFVVADAGIGIPGSMGVRNHAAALLNAINEGVTRDAEKNAGNGLYGSYRVASLSGGILEIHSLRGFLLCKPPKGKLPKGEIVNDSEKVPYGGTSVRCGIGLGEGKLLDKALQFKGEPHDPPYDHIERRFEDDAGHLIFNVKQEARHDLGSREGGRRIRGIIGNLLRERRPVVLDFDGVSVISSSFADEVFGRLFVEMGPRAFMKQILMLNVDVTVEGLIDRAIMQRTKLGNGDAG
ncbi:MAG: DUF4325 domain-containing protein [Gammaproteobacteria bacterium]|nr:DUF4325 domain-containing protein [Gammaproteobacteria bacterium]